LRRGEEFPCGEARLLEIEELLQMGGCGKEILAA
jgi:hypothetical protein